MALLPPGSAGVPGTDVHNDLGGRSAPDAHPMAAITGLSDWVVSTSTTVDALRPLSFRYIWSNTSIQNIPAPAGSAVIVVRTEDGAVITPGLRHTTPTNVELTFSPPISGDHVAYVVR
jgi:hypothetical protein